MIEGSKSTILGGTTTTTRDIGDHRVCGMTKEKGRNEELILYV